MCGQEVLAGSSAETRAGGLSVWWLHDNQSRYMVAQGFKGTCPEREKPVKTAWSCLTERSNHETAVAQHLQQTLPLRWSQVQGEGTQTAPLYGGYLVALYKSEWDGRL